MADFRRLFTALAVLALFAGLASAQVGTGSGGTQEQCVANVAVTPQLRSEGYTEATGDVTLTCTGGANQPVGSAIPQANITVFLNTAVTSRLLPSASGTAGGSSSASEALLLVDEPGSGLTAPVPGYGPAAPQILCTSPATGCQEFVGSVGGTAVPVTSSSGTPPATQTAPNVFQGIVSGNSVTFLGVPILAPVTAGTSRVYRITNIRANATVLSGGSAAGATPVIASIAISGATTLLISNATPTVGFVQSGLSASASSASNQNQCSSQTRTSINTLTFSENFATAFKTRVEVNANNGTAYAGQTPPPPGLQNIPGQVYNSESDFIYPISSTQVAGLADFGTRLKATFNNIPAGVRLFVSVNNVVNNGAPMPPPATIGGNSLAGNGTTGPQPYAGLVISETATDGNASAGFFPAAASTDTAPGGSGNVPVAEILVTNGAAQAVWEILNASTTTQESLKFAVYATYSSNVGNNSPPPGTGTVNLSFAPTPPAFSSSAGASASASLTVPRFIADPNAPRNILNINICRTVLIYPFVTNILGFDTGIAIANTSTDPFGTAPQAGACTLNWYSGPGSPAPTNTGTIASGTVYATLASTTVAGFNGYMIAVCNFQYAHGFAFVSDVGARNLAMGYLPLVISDPTSQSNGVRNAVPIAGGSGEQDAH